MVRDKQNAKNHEVIKVILKCCNYETKVIIKPNFYTAIFIMVKPTIVSEVNHPKDRSFVMGDPGHFWQLDLAIGGPVRA
ncbi:hypothetical protein BGP_4877 [Beggiatoa sp. PS]|nr:hypothetical protein BGP_4877 [Beggiatoa sp. PS]